MICPACGFESPEGARFCGGCGTPLERRCSECGAPAAPGISFCTMCGDAARRGSRAAAEPARPEGGRGEERKVVTVALRRPRRLHGPRRAARPRGRAAHAAPVPRAAPRRARALRRHGREVHRRRGHGAVRRAGRARGRPRAGGARGARDPRRDRRADDGTASSCASGSGSRPARRSSTLGARPERGRGHGRRRRRQHGRAAAVRGAGERDPRRTSRRTARRARDRLRGGASRSRRRARRSPSASGRRSTRALGFGVDVRRRGGAPLVGRERSSTCSSTRSPAPAASRRRSSSRSSAFPGIGKSRLVASCSRVVDAEPELILAAGPLAALRRRRHVLGARRDGRRRRPGSSRPTPPTRPSEKLATAVAAAVADRGRAWVDGPPAPARRPRAQDDVAGDRRGEAFAAWRRFFEALAEQRPLVLVFEDLHWADDGLLDFVDHLVDWAGGRAAARRLHRAPGAARAAARLGRRQAQRVDALALAARGRGHGAAVGALLEQAVLAGGDAGGAARARRREPALRRGVRAHARRPRVLARGGRCGSRGELPLPETVQGIIAARLDALPRRREGAAPGRGRGRARSSGSARSRRSRAEPRARSRSGCTRSSGRSSSGGSAARPSRGETQYAFRHVLVRDVAYGQIPRARRADKHRPPREWIESLGRPRRGPRRDARAPLPAGARVRPRGRAAARTWALARPARLALARGRRPRATP